MSASEAARPSRRATPESSPAREVRRAVEVGLADLPDDERVLVAVSGGADSLALARGVAATGRPMTVGIIDHGLQTESAQVARKAAETCADLGIETVLVETVVVAHRGTGPEAAAREARRDALEAMADRVGARVILLAHTRDDQAETVLLRLARGSGARSLAAMAPASGRWRRPLLNVPRDIVRRSVADLMPWEDPHNADRAYARSRVRHVALPALVDALGDDVIAGLTRSARLLRDDADALDAVAMASAAGVTAPDGSLDANGLAALPRAVRTRIIRSAILAAGVPRSSLTADHVDRVEALISEWHGQGPLDLPGSIAAERRYGRLEVHRVPPVADRRRDNGEE